MIVSNFERIRQGERPTIYGDGKQSLDYVYVDDVVDALIALCDPANDGALCNLGSGTATSVNDLTDLMVDVAGADAEPEMCPPDWTAGSVRVADPAHARNRLGWQSRTPLREGLERVWDWMEATGG